MSDVIVRLQGVQRIFDNGLVRGLDGVDLEIRRGEAVAIMGPSGSGKSTLLNIIGTLDFPTAGSVELMGHVIDSRQNLDDLRASQLGFIFQLHNLLPNQSLLENVMLPMQTRGLSGAEMRHRATALLERVGLGARTRFLPVHVSGGERQRTAIARALANDPQLLLGDEPTGNLDSDSGRRIMELILEMARTSNKTLIIVTHNPEIAELHERKIRLVDGKIVADIRRNR